MPALTQQLAQTDTAATDTRQAERIDALTSLRFIAAAMIVVTHSVYAFNMDPTGNIGKLPLSQGVSFFFVLSGFILTYVYQNLQGIKKTLRFLSARIARVWPVFFVTEIAALLISPWSINATTTGSMLSVAASHFFMLHGWIPKRFYYFALNAPSWSISTEFFFYLAFPFLILNLRKQWLPKLVLVAAIPLTIITLCNVLGLKEIPGAKAISSHGLIYINPLTRLLEFYAGMLVCLLVRSIKGRHASKVAIPASPALSSKIAFTALEIFAFVWIAAVIANTNQWLKLAGIDAHSAAGMYLNYCGNALGYVVLIFAIAMQRGHISRLLNLPILIFLGEVSYSVYLWHSPLIECYRQHTDLFMTIPRVLRYSLFWGVLIAVSTLTYFIVEKPCRDILRQWLNKQVDKLPGV